MANDVNVGLILNPTTEKGAFKKIGDEAQSAGKSAGESFSAGLATGLKAIAAIGAVAIGGLAIALKKGVDAAQVQENAVNRLNTALQITGKFSQSASEELQRFASQLQSTSKFGDEAILSTAGFIQQLANLDTKGLKRATQASVELASALRIDLESAGSLVAKAIEGNTGALGRYGIKVKASADETQNLSNVLTAIESKFSGSARGEINTYAGAITQASNSFGDLLEEVGNFVIKSPIVISLIKDARDGFVSAGAAIADFRKNSFSAMKDVINPLVEFNEGVITYVIAPLELIYNYAGFLGNFWKTVLNGMVAGVGKLGGAIGFILEKIGGESELTKGLKDFSDSSGAVFKDAADAAIKSFQTIVDFPLADSLFQKNEGIREALAARNQDMKQANDQMTQAAAEQAVSLSTVFSNVFDSLTSKAASSTAKANMSMKQFADATGKAVQQGIGVAAGNAFAAFGKALVEGDNAIKAFTSSFIASIGQIAVQQGTAFILQGIAYSFMPQMAPLAGGLIAAGAAMAAFGGALSAVTAKGGKPAVGGGGINSFADTQIQGGSFGDISSSPEETAQRSESGPRVQVTIQGNVFDSEETGNRLIDIINANFENKGNSFNNANFA